MWETIVGMSRKKSNILGDSNKICIKKYYK